MSLERILAELSDESKPLGYTELCELSALSPEELRRFREAWARMSTARQGQIMDRLAALAEENCGVNFDDIFRACLDDPVEMIRVKAIEGLWECDDRSLIAPLIAMLREDSEESVRAAAATALGRFAMLAELGKLRPKDRAKVQKALFDAIENQEEQLEVRRRAIEAISYLSLSKVRDIIRQAYEDGNAKMRASAIYAMGRNCDPVWLPLLIGELASFDSEMRFEAAGACGELGSDEAVPHLIRLIYDIDTQVQLSAIAALGHIGGSEAEEALRQLLEHSEEYIRQAAKEALEEVEQSEEPVSFKFES